MLSLIQRCLLTLPVMNSPEDEERNRNRERRRIQEGGKHGGRRRDEKRRLERGARRARTGQETGRGCCSRDSTHYRMYAPHAIFDVAVGRAQMKLLPPRGVDFSSKRSRRATPTSSSSSCSVPVLAHAFQTGNDAVIITFNESYSRRE